jgi:hypothetical protein
MKSLCIAIYASIVIHFLRMTARKLSPDIPGKPRGTSHGEFQGHPVQVGVGITYTKMNPRPDGSRTSYDYVRVATCIDLDTASALANTLNGMKPGYGHRFSLIDPDEEINRYKLEVLKSDKIHLLRDNFRNCPNPCLLAKIMQSAAISVILHEANPHC